MKKQKDQSKEIGKVVCDEMLKVIKANKYEKRSLKQTVTHVIMWINYLGYKIVKESTRNG